MKERLPQFLSIALAVLLLGAAWAGPEHDDGEQRGMHRSHHGMMRGGPDFEHMVERMSRHLELDDNQEQAIRNIVDAAKPEAEALHEQLKAMHEARRELDVADADYDVKLQNLAVKNGELVTHLTLLHGRVMADVSAELSDDQKAKLSEGRHRMHKGFRHHHRSGESPDDTTT